MPKTTIAIATAIDRTLGSLCWNTTLDDDERVSTQLEPVCEKGVGMQRRLSNRQVCGILDRQGEARSRLARS